MNWKQKVQEIAKFHYESNNLQIQTAERLNLTPKKIHKILEVYVNLSDPEIQSCESIEIAYKTSLKIKNEKKKQILENLFNGENET